MNHNLQNISPDVLYKINIFAVVEDSNKEHVESKELHEKASFKNDNCTECHYNDCR